MKKIAILIPWFHPAYKAGGPIQSIAGLIRQLNGEPVEFSIICGNRDLDGTELNVEPDQWVRNKQLTMDNEQCRIWYSSSGNIRQVLKAEIKIQKPTALFVVGLYDWNYNFKPLLLAGGVKKIISVRGMLHPGALSQKTFKKKIYLTIWKLLGWHKKHLFHVTDETEGGYVRKTFGRNARIAVAGNFPSLHSSLPMPSKRPAQLKLVSVALIGPMKNHLEVLTALGTVKGEIDYQIYGPVIDEPYWKQCQHMIELMPSTVSVTYCGAVVPAEIEKILSENHVFILPSKSENYGHSIIEALSAGRPVITSKATPWNGLQEARAGMNVDPGTAELTNAIEYFVKMDQPEMDEWGRGAGAYAVKAVDVEAVREQYRSLFNAE